MDRLAPFEKKHAHLIGAAGAGMQSLGQLLRDAGWTLSGSDLEPLPGMYRGHAAGHVGESTDLVVYSPAIPADNPERREAQRRGIPACSYPEMLGQVMSSRRGIAVAGTHGKSTTAALLASILLAAGEDPSYVIGAQPQGEFAGGRCGEGPWFVAEACEYREHFLTLTPEVAVLLGIEPDHFDFFSSQAHVRETFARFAGRLPAGGLLLAHQGCAATMEIARQLACRVVGFGYGPAADWQVADVAEVGHAGQFRLVHTPSGRAVSLRLPLPGRHNVLNAAAAAATAFELGLPTAAVRKGIGQFRGIRRRLQQLGRWRGVACWDDYAHHPTEVTAVLSTLRRLYPRRRLWCIFQPHQASRTVHLLEQFALSLQLADRVAVADVFHAREKSGASPVAAELAERTSRYGAAVLPQRNMAALAEHLKQSLQPQDVLVTLGAGDIWKLHHEFTEGIRRHRAA